MQDRNLVDIPLVAYADVEDGHVYLIQSVLVKDTDPELDEVWALVGASAPTEEYEESNSEYLHKKVRIRRWKL